MANQHPPWNTIRNPPEFLVGLRDKCKKHLSDERRKGLAMEFIRSLPDTEITAWTDGSVCNKSGGAGAVVYSAQGCKELREGVGILCSSYRTEMWAIAVALRERAVNHPGKSITIFTDSLSAVESLRRGPTTLYPTAALYPVEQNPQKSGDMTHQRYSSEVCTLFCPWVFPQRDESTASNPKLSALRN